MTIEIDERFQQLYEETYVFAASLVTARCRQTADVGDIVQEVYLELYRILRKYGCVFIREPQAMIRKLVKQKLFWYYRDHSRRREIYPDPDEDGHVHEIEDIETLSVEEICEDRDTLAQIDRFLTDRGEIYRKIFHLYFRLGISIPEIASLLQMNENTVKTKLYRTLKELRSQLKGE